MNRREKGRIYRSRLVSRIFGRYLLAMLGVVLASLILWGLAQWLAQRRVWQEEEWIYRTFSSITNRMILLGVMCLAGWAAVSAAFLARPFRYLDQIIAAAQALASPSEQAVALHPDLREVQDEMNLIRERSLRHAYLAREAEQRKNDLILYLAHDLKTPLTSVIGYLTLLRDEPDLAPQTRARYTAIAWDKAQRLEALVDEFFEITRFSLSHMPLEKERVNLSRLLEQVASEFEPAMADKGLSWRLSIPPGLTVLGDGDKLARVFDNLARNAVSYAYPQSPLSLSARGEGNQVTVSLSNQGKTIPQDKLQRIFQQFFRLDGARSSSTGGAGLGLAIAKEIVEQHGGRIRAASRSETVTFTVTLPAPPPPDGSGPASGEAAGA